MRYATYIPFDLDVAEIFGNSASIVFGYVKYWNGRNKAGGKAVIDGVPWMYQSYTEMIRGLHGVINEKTLRVALAKMENCGIVRCGCFNKKGYDKTRWYTVYGNDGNCIFDSLTDKDFEAMGVVKITTAGGVVKITMGGGKNYQGGGKNYQTNTRNRNTKENYIKTASVAGATRTPSLDEFINEILDFDFTRTDADKTYYDDCGREFKFTGLDDADKVAVVEWYYDDTVRKGNTPSVNNFITAGMQETFAKAHARILA